MAGGRPPKEKSFANMLAIALNQADGVSLDGKPNTKLRQVAEILVSKALEGEGWAIKEIADRTDGKPIQAIEGDFEHDVSDALSSLLTNIAAKGVRLINADEG